MVFSTCLTLMLQVLLTFTNDIMRNLYDMRLSTDLTRVLVWTLGSLMVSLSPCAWCVVGLVWIRSGAVRMDTCCCRPPAMLPLLVRTKEYSVSGCSWVISFLFRFPCTSTLCWLYRICKQECKKWSHGLRFYTCEVYDVNKSSNPSHLTYSNTQKQFRP